MTFRSLSWLASWTSVVVTAFSAASLADCAAPYSERARRREDLASVHRFIASWGARFGPPASLSAVSAACTSLEAATSFVCASLMDFSAASWTWCGGKRACRSGSAVLFWK